MAVQLGWLDTNVFVHALQPNDHEYARSREVLDALAGGRAKGWLSPLVAHELTYVLRRFPAYQTRTAIQTYLLTILSNPNVQAEDKPMLVAAVTRWAVSASLVPQAGSLSACSARYNVRDDSSKRLTELAEPFPAKGTSLRRCLPY